MLVQEKVGRLLALVHEKTTSERLNNILEVTEWGQGKKV